MADLLKDLTKVANKSWKMGKDYALGTPEIEIKVREATSNEPWGPTTQEMQGLAHASHSYADLPIIMNMLWKRMQDAGKNWRHVYKSLIVLDYLLKHGSEQSIREMRYHIVDLQTLTSFQYVDENYQDMGQSVRERAKKVLELLHDEKRLKEERTKAQQNRSKYQGYGSDSGMRGGPRSGYDYRENGGYPGDYYGRDSYPREERDPYGSSASPRTPSRSSDTDRPTYRSRAEERSDSDSDSELELPVKSTGTQREQKGSPAPKPVPRQPGVGDGEEFDPFKQLATSHALKTESNAVPAREPAGSVLPLNLFDPATVPSIPASKPPPGAFVGAPLIPPGGSSTNRLSPGSGNLVTSTAPKGDSDWDNFVGFDDPKKPKPNENDIWNKHKNLFDLQHLSLSEKETTPATQQKRPMASMATSGRGRGTTPPTAGSPTAPKPGTGPAPLSPAAPSGTAAVRAPPLAGSGYPGVTAVPYGMSYAGAVAPGMVVPSVGYAPGIPGMMPMGYHAAPAPMPYGSAPVPSGGLTPQVYPTSTAAATPSSSSSGPSLLF